MRRRDAQDLIYWDMAAFLKQLGLMPK